MRSTVWLSILILGFQGCAGDAPELDPAPLSGPGEADGPLRQEASTAAEHSGMTAEPAPTGLPGPGDVCPDAQCDDTAICIGGICHRKCTQAAPSCNDVVKGCSAEEVCLPATSFTDACFAASAKTGEACGVEGAGAICRAGNLCVAAGPDSPARCLKLCKYGCGAGQCVQTNNGCSVCL